MIEALSNAAIELSAAQVRAAKIDSNRRALAALLHHHGDRPLERDCSEEARRIRQALFGGAERAGSAGEMTAGEAASSESAMRLMLAEARPAILAIVAEVAAKHDVPIRLLLAPPRRAAADSAERRAQLANREAMYRAYQACPNYRALGLHFGKHSASIRRAAERHAKRMTAGEGAR